MIILPAIDLLDGQCVRLKKGDYGTSHKVADDPFLTAKYFEDCGAKWVHIVDLNGARNGDVANDKIVKEIAKSNLKVETGGGIRSVQRAEELLSAGVDRVIFGSIATKNSQVVQESVKEFGEKIAVSIDADKGFVKTDGWVQNSNLYFVDFAKKMFDLGVKTLIFTDIAKDGMLCGSNYEQLEKLQQNYAGNIIASGGIANISDIEKLNTMQVYGAICGKSIYSGTLDLKQAIEVCKNNI